LNQDSTYLKTKNLAMQKPLPLSVCMISGAEAPRIGRALESIAGLASETLIVLNSEVKDDTEKLALQHGATVFREPWKGFVGQKNSATEKAAQPWLLNIDADESVSPELAREIAGVIEAPIAKHAAYEFPRCTYYCGRWIRHGDWYPDRVLRLWRRGTAQWTGEEPHARLQVSGSVGRLQADLFHFTNATIAQHVQKIIPYSDGFLHHNLAEGRTPTVFDFVVRPFWRFVRAYFLRFGFLDGWQGYYIAWLNAFSAATRYARLRERQPVRPNDHETFPRR
jgi:glycosyltransferase involved in cell wall biosynthesis